MRCAHEIKSNLAVERQLPGSFSVSAGYLGGRGIHLWREGDVNAAFPLEVDGRPFVPAGARCPNPNLGVGTVRNSDAQSFYN